MKLAVSALIALSLVLVIGCENDENTVDPIPKYHDVYPVIHLKIDNAYRTFGIDSLQMTTTPGIGWPGPVYSDENGFIGAMASGTFVDYIDTIVEPDTTIYDTTWIVYGFQPSTSYNFSFNRGEPFVWLDSFRADYAVTVESLWVLLSADTVDATTSLDPSNPPVTVLDRVEIDTGGVLVPPPDSTVDQELLYGYWFDTAYVISNPDDTVNYPPDSTYFDTVVWAFWNRIDSFYLPPDSSIWCNLDSMVIVEETLFDTHQNPSIVIDSVYYYSACNPVIDTVEERIYNLSGWGIYPGGDDSEAPIPTYDTIIHFTFPDTAKILVIDPGGLSILVPDQIDPDTHDTTWRTMEAEIEYIHNGVPTSLDNLSIDVTMPPVEVFPEYDFIIREGPPAP
jgi:hypothetical protein